MLTPLRSNQRPVSLEVANSTVSRRLTVLRRLVEDLSRRVGIVGMTDSQEKWRRFCRHRMLHAPWSQDERVIGLVTPHLA